MNLTPGQRCPKCGIATPGKMPGGLCPRCLLSGAFTPLVVPTEDGEDSGETVPLPGGVSNSIAVGRRFGNFELLEVIGQGGYGIVWRARQLKPDRVVALKMLLFGKSATADEVLRFKQEAELTAKLGHPNIVQVHEVGEIEGQHYFSMEHVEGPNLGELFRGKPLSAKIAARYIKLTAEAVHFAHRKGVIHRDLKPSNVLLDPHDQPRLTDFGLARWLAGNSNLTMSGTALGSLPFASPEQASGQWANVGVASDVYSLGGTLYHLLTGRAPFTGETHAVILRQVLDKDPVAPKELNPSVPKDLETICLKCLQKHSNQRYSSARALADDLARFLGGEAIHARPISAAEKTWRWCLRHPKEAALTAALVIISGLLIGFQLSAAHAKKQEQLRQLFTLDSQYARLAVQSAGWSLRVSNSAALAKNSGPKPELRDQLAALLPGMDATLVRRLERLNEAELVQALPGSKVLIIHQGSAAKASQPNPMLKVWDYQTDQTKQFELRGNGPAAWLSNAVPLQLVRSSSDRLSYAVWDLARGEIWREFLVPFKSAPDKWTLLSQRPCRLISPDGSRIVVAQPLSRGEGTLCVWDTASEQRVFETNCSYAGNINTLAISADGELLAVGLDNGLLVLWSITSGRQWRPLRDNGAQIRSLAFHRKAHTDESGTNSSKWLLAAGDAGKVVTIWDLSTMLPRSRLIGHAVESVAFNPDGVSIATGGDGNVQLWDSATGRQMLQIPAGDTQTGLKFSDDGRRLFISDSIDGGSVSVWDLGKDRPTKTLRGLRSQISKVCFSANGGRVAAFSKSHEVAVWDLADGRLVRVWEVPHELKSQEASLALDANGAQLAFASERSIKWWFVDSGVTRNQRRIRPGIGNVVAFDGPDRLLIFRQENRTPGVVPYPEADPAEFPRFCRLYRLLPESSEQIAMEITNFNHVAYAIRGSSDGRHFVVDGPCVSNGQTNRVLTCFDGVNLQQRWSRTLGPGHPEGEALRIDSSGRSLVVTDDTNSVGLRLDLESGAPLAGEVHTYPLAIGPGGTNWVAWNHKTGRGLSLFIEQNAAPLVTLGVDAPSVGQPAFSANGHALAWGQTDGSVLLFNISELRKRFVALGLD